MIKNKTRQIFTSSMRKLGSGEMTVLLEKSTLLPDRLPRKRPCLPFSLWQNPLVGFLGCCLKEERVQINIDINKYENVQTHTSFVLLLNNKDGKFLDCFMNVQQH